MIYTLTLNPAIDYVVKIDRLSLGELNRLNDEQIFIGGKGINVSRVLKNLGVDSIALGFVAGFTGDAVKNNLEGLGIKTDFVNLMNGNTRINVKVKTDVETELNGNGPFVCKEEEQKLFEKADNLENGDIVVMSGSNAFGLDCSIYSKLMQRLSGKNVKFVVDASGELLKNTFCFKPWLIKPNKQELEQFLGIKLNTPKAVEESAIKLCEMGAQNVLVSLGADGAIFVNKNAKYKVTVPKGKARNTVGAGDSMVAGFLAGYTDNENLEKALRLAAATGSATAFSDDLAKKADVIALVDVVKVERI